MRGDMNIHVNCKTCFVWCVSLQGALAPAGCIFLQLWLMVLTSVHMTHDHVQSQYAGCCKIREIVYLLSTETQGFCCQDQQQATNTPQRTATFQAKANLCFGEQMQMWITESHELFLSAQKTALQNLASLAKAVGDMHFGTLSIITIANAR